MAFSTKLTKIVLPTVLPLNVKTDYSITFYTGGIPLDKWEEHTPKEQAQALKKDWYIRWSYRNPVTGKLEKQNNIKSGLNRLSTFADRKVFLIKFRQGMINSFAKGVNPFAEEEKRIAWEESFMSARDALNHALSLKNGKISPNTYKDYRIACERFIKHLEKEGKDKHDIRSIDRRAVSDYLSKIQKKTSARNRNNHRAVLSALFSELRDEFYIERNFIDTDIRKVSTKSKTDRRFSNEQMREIAKYLKEKDPHLLLYIKIVAYNFLRPVEVNRLRICDIDLEAREMYFDQKTKLGKTKYIPNIYYDDLAALVARGSGTQYLFTPEGVPGEWPVGDNQRRDYFTKRFAKVKEDLNISGQYGLYSFRHNFITGTYIVLRKTMGQLEAIEYLMKITGHTSRDGILKYIHENDADRPEDWSDLIGFKL